MFRVFDKIIIDEHPLVLRVTKILSGTSSNHSIILRCSCLIGAERHRVDKLLACVHNLTQISDIKIRNWGLGGICNRYNLEWVSSHEEGDYFLIDLKISNFVNNDWLEDGF